MLNLIYGDGFVICASMEIFIFTLEIEPEYGVMNVKPISTYEMTRIEDMDPDNPQLCCV